MNTFGILSPYSARYRSRFCSVLSAVRFADLIILGNSYPAMKRWPITGPSAGADSASLQHQKAVSRIEYLVEENKSVGDSTKDMNRGGTSQRSSRSPEPQPPQEPTSPDVKPISKVAGGA